MSSALFAASTFGRPGLWRGGVPLSHVTYAVVDLETTGLNPAADRIVEIAIRRIRADGAVEDEYTTLVNPGRPARATFIHHITDEMLGDAPPLPAVFGDVVARLDGAVVVAHNAAFEERFLAAELARAGVRLPTLPVVDSLDLARGLLPTCNHKLGTCCQHLNIPLVDAHTALGDVRATSQLVVRLTQIAAGDDDSAQLLLGAPLTPLPVIPVTARPKRRVSALRKGTDGWMASLLAKLPVTALPDAAAASGLYLDLLADVLADGKIIGEEARQLAGLACDAGLSVADVQRLNSVFLDDLRVAALDDDILTAAELRQLTNAAAALGQPDRFAELHPTQASTARVPDPRPATELREDLATTVAKAASGTGLKGQRILLLASGTPALDLRTAVETLGGACCVNLTKSVTSVVVDAASVRDPRVEKALLAGAPVFPISAAWHHFRLNVARHEEAGNGHRRESGAHEVPDDRPADAEAAAGSTMGAAERVERQMTTGAEPSDDAATQTTPRVVTLDRPADAPGPMVHLVEPVEAVHVGRHAQQHSPSGAAEVQAARHHQRETEVVLPPAAWYADPTGRFHHRYWDGRQWTHHVASSGVAAMDPL